MYCYKLSTEQKAQLSKLNIRMRARAAYERAEHEEEKASLPPGFVTSRDYRKISRNVFDSQRKVWR